MGVSAADSGEKRTRILEQRLHGVEEASAFGAVDYPMIAGQAEWQCGSRKDHAVLRHDLFERPACGEDPHLGVVDDRGCEAAAVAADVGDRESAAYVKRAPRP